MGSKDSQIQYNSMNDWMCDLREKHKLYSRETHWMKKWANITILMYNVYERVKFEEKNICGQKSFWGSLDRSKVFVFDV